MPYCVNCGAFVPEGMPHSCKKVPAYSPPGLSEEDRRVVISIDSKTAQAIQDIQTAINALTLNAQAQTWAKNKLLSIEQAIDNLQVAIDLLNEKIP